MRIRIAREVECHASTKCNSMNYQGGTVNAEIVGRGSDVANAIVFSKIDR